MSHMLHGVASREIIFKQFNVWYYDFNYNDKRVKTCTRIEDALAFARMLVRDREELHVRFLSLESVY